MMRHLTKQSNRGIILNMQKYNIYLPKQQIRSLETLSNTTGITISDHVRRAIKDYIEKEMNGWSVSEAWVKERMSEYFVRKDEVDKD